MTPEAALPGTYGKPGLVTRAAETRAWHARHSERPELSSVFEYQYLVFLWILKCQKLY